MTSCLCCTVTLVVDGATNESQAVKLSRLVGVEFNAPLDTV